MAGSLVLIDEFTISSAVASVTLGGGSSGSSGLNATIDSTFDVYLVIYDNVQPSTDAQKLNIRFTVSGSPDTSSNYDKAQWVQSADGGSNAQGTSNSSSLDNLDQGGTGTEENLQGLNYLYNFNKSDEYSYITYEGSARSSAAILNARNGAGVLTVAQATDGIQYFFGSGNIETGTFKLYGIKN